MRWKSGVLGVVLLFGSTGCAFLQRVDGGSGQTPNTVGPDMVLSRTARYVAFSANAPSLGQQRGNFDVFVRDTRTGTIARVTTEAADGDFRQSFPVAVSEDGDTVAYATTYTTVPGDFDTVRRDAYVWNRQTGQSELISVAPSGTANGDSTPSAMSNDGRFVVFDSEASNLVPGDTNTQLDGFIRDRTSGTTTRVTLTSTGAQIPHHDGQEMFTRDVTDDGTSVLIVADVALIPSDTNATVDSYVRNRDTNAVERVSVADDESQLGVTSFSLPGSMTPGGRYVIFSSELPTPGGERSVSIRDRQLQTTTRLDRQPGESVAETTASAAGVSDDGRFVLMIASTPASATANNIFNVYVRDRSTGARLLVSANLAGGAVTDVWNDGHLSGDGRYATFLTQDSFLPGDTNGDPDQFLRATFVPRIDAASAGVDPIGPGASGTLVVTGAYLLGGLDPTLGEGVSVTGVDVTDEHHATIDFSVAPDAGPGPRTLAFLNAGTGPGGVSGVGFFPGALVIGP